MNQEVSLVHTIIHLIEIVALVFGALIVWNVSDRLSAIMQWAQGVDDFLCKETGTDGPLNDERVERWDDPRT